MKVCEIFSSIQGESSFAGYPCVFVRLTGCNLRCSFCDTTYAYEEGTDIPAGEVIDRVGSFGIRLVEVTGGEPLLQAEAYDLMDKLLDRGHHVLLETNGSVDISDVDRRCSIILDMKTPSSAMSGRMLLKNLELLSKKDDLKFVIGNREDYEWARDMVLKHSLQEKTNILLSPVFGLLEPSKLAAWMVEDKLEARLNLQLHKYIFGPDARGV